MRNVKIKSLLRDLESDCVERTVSMTNTDKFGQVIGSFANDLPNHRQMGNLFLGVKDDGKRRRIAKKGHKLTQNIVYTCR